MIISKKYEVLSQLGEGGMGVVYKVRHTALENVSALKVMSTHFGDDPDLVKRFYREARVLARLNHPNIVRVIDIERDEELKFYYFVMEYIEGQTLRDHLRESGPLRIAQVLAITKQVAAALNFAHHYNPPVIHRDIKPTNIMIEDGSQRVVVMDFGIAKDLGDIEMTRVGTMLGTLRYAPPEQLRHEALDGSADIYALGMVMYEALLGSHPFADLAEYPVFARVASPEEHDFGFPPGTPPSFAALVSKAIRKDRSQRYRTMAELIVDIDVCSFELGEATPGAVPAPGPGRGPPAGMPGEPTEVAAAVREDKIRGLSEQRRRQQIRRLEAQVAEHKDMALRHGAAELVPDLFTAACAAEDLAHAQTKGDQFAPACQSLEEAIAGFKEASEQAAREGLQRQAGQARAQTAAAKVEADRYGATERAQTVYRNGLMLQAKADALWENQSYREAGPAAGCRPTQPRATPRAALGQGAALPRARRARGRRRVLLHAGGAGAHTSGTRETRGPGGDGAAGSRADSTGAGTTQADAKPRCQRADHAGRGGVPDLCDRRPGYGLETVALCLVPGRRAPGYRTARRGADLVVYARLRRRRRTSQGNQSRRQRCRRSQGREPLAGQGPGHQPAAAPVAAMPTTQTLTVKSGKMVRFSVQGEDPDRDDALAYVWNVDGAPMAKGERFEIKSGTPGARQRVEVAAIDRAGLSERRSWEIAVEAPPSLPPLAIRAASPEVAPGQELVLTEGQNQTFSIEVAGGDPAALEYVWQLDGKKQATGSRWTYKAPASASRTKELRVVVSGDAGPPLEHLWRIRVNPANRAPTEKKPDGKRSKIFVPPSF